jgi:hypothetical protein
MLWAPRCRPVALPCEAHTPPPPLVLCLLSDCALALLQVMFHKYLLDDTTGNVLAAPPNCCVMHLWLGQTNTVST